MTADGQHVKLTVLSSGSGMSPWQQPTDDITPGAFSFNILLECECKSTAPCIQD